MPQGGFLMTARERFTKTMAFEKTDRLPLIEWAAWWNETIDRWRNEGLPEHLKTEADIMEYFGLDIHKSFWIPTLGATFPWPKTHGAGSFTDLTPEGYKEFKQHILPKEAVQWFADDIKKWAVKQQQSDTIIWLMLDGYFWFPRKIMGIEPHLYAFYDQPEVMHMINEDLYNFHVRVLDEFLELCTPDFIAFAEDMSYNNGPMISRPVFDEFITPYYKRLMAKINSHNIPVIVDSDGDITELVPWFKNFGASGFLPLERQAGVDIKLLREQHPDLRIVGGFDKTVMHLGEAAMRQEFERLLPVMKQGGYIPSVDHQTPPGVSLEDYKLYVSLLKEYCAKI